MKVWITGLRKSQSASRSDIELLDWDHEYSLIKVNPLLNWTEPEVWTYIRSHKVPYNTLHDSGYPSIGCLPCTRAVLPGEDIRAGRWWWEDESNRECGLHDKEDK
jgi:phosphoadenosine phosphosulfate reductase